jgi:hypothetical protein
LQESAGKSVDAQNHTLRILSTFGRRAAVFARRAAGAQDDEGIHRRAEVQVVKELIDRSTENEVRTVMPNCA